MEPRGPAEPLSPPYRPSLFNLPRAPYLSPLNLQSGHGSIQYDFRRGPGLPPLNLPSELGLLQIYLPGGNGLYPLSLPGGPVTVSDPNRLMPPFNVPPRILEFNGGDANPPPAGPAPSPTSLPNGQFVVAITANPSPPDPAPSSPDLRNEEFVIGINDNPPPLGPALPSPSLPPIAPPLPPPPQVQKYYGALSSGPSISRGSPATLVATSIQAPIRLNVASISEYLPNPPNDNRQYGINFDKYSRFPLSTVVGQSHPVIQSYYRKYFPGTSYYRKYFPSTST